MTRKFVSLTLLLSFILLAISSFMLYIVPEGRIAFWSHWTALSFSKEEWGAMHLTGGILFILFCFWHILLNIRPLKAYILGKKGYAAVLCSVLACLLCYTATLQGWQPTQFILDLNQQIKADQEKKHGTPPYGHAEKSSLSTFCSFLKLDEARVVEGLKERGIDDFNPAQTLEDIAVANGITPALLYKKILDIPGMTPSMTGKGRGRRAAE